MSAADHPTWAWVKQKALKPTLFDRGIRMGSAFALGLFFWYLTGNVLALNISIACFIIIPNAVVGIIDVYLRIRISLLALLLAIVTLQVPVLLLVTAESDDGIGTGIISLVLWILVFGAYIQDRLEESERTKKQQAEARTE